MASPLLLSGLVGGQVDAVRSFGGPTVTVRLHGKNYDEASEEALRLAREEGLTMVHPFDDPDVIAGQGRPQRSGRRTVARLTWRVLRC